MPNLVTIDSAGVIHQSIVGDQDGTTISQLIEHATALIRERNAQHPDAPVLFLINIDAIGEIKMSARQTGVKALRNTPFHRLAIVGGNRFTKYSTSLVIMASGMGSKVKQFDNETSAIHWLTGQRP